MENKIARILVIMILVMIIPCAIFAYSGVDTNVQIGNTNAVNSSAEITGRLVGVFQVAGTIISVIALIVIGIRYMVSSVEERAQLKGVLWYYVIGAILVFATSNVLAWGYEAIDSVQHNWDSGKITKLPTCVTVGIKTYTCTICDKTRTEEIESTGTHIWDAGRVTIESTCARVGETLYTCTYECGTTKTEPIAKKTKHTWNDGSITTPATCATTGVRTKTCTVSGCGETKTEPIPKATTHSWNGGRITTPATCKTTGVRTKICTICKKTETNPIPKTDHLWNSGTVTKAATCAATGTMLYTCTVCSATAEEVIHIDESKHDYYTIETIVEATCKKVGEYKNKCRNCGKETTTTGSFDSWNHESSDFEYYNYKSNSNGTHSYNYKHACCGVWVGLAGNVSCNYDSKTCVRYIGFVDIGKEYTCKHCGYSYKDWTP